MSKAWFVFSPPTNCSCAEYFCQGRVVFAQDREGRHVALKLVQDSTDEQRIFNLLLEEQKTRKDMMIPGILPTLDLLPFSGHWLAVMPR